MPPPVQDSAVASVFPAQSSAWQRARGLGADEMKRIARCIAMTAKDFEGTADAVKAEVADICAKFPMYV